MDKKNKMDNNNIREIQNKEFNEEDYKPQIVELINDSGELEKLVIEASFHLDDIKYVVLREENSEEGMIYTVDEDKKGDITFNMIEDEEELKEVIELYEAMADDII